MIYPAIDYGSLVLVKLSHFFWLCRMRGSDAGRPMNLLLTLKFFASVICPPFNGLLAQKWVLWWRTIIVIYVCERFPKTWYNGNLGLYQRGHRRVAFGFQVSKYWVKIHFSISSSKSISQKKHQFSGDSPSILAPFNSKKFLADWM